MNPNESGSTMTTRKALAIVGSLLLLTLISLVIPAKWLGVTPVKRDGVVLDLSTPLDNTSLGVPKEGWRELVTSNLPPEEIKKIESKLPNPEIIKNLNDPNNLTASFSKNLFVASTYLAKTPGATKEQEQNILNQLMAQEAKKIVYTTYSINDITIATSEDKNSIKAYGNNVARITNNMITAKNIEDGFGGFGKFLEGGDKNNLIALKKDSTRIEGVLKNLLALSVPPSATLYHLSAINQIALYKDTLENLSKADSDSLRASLFVQSYPDTLVNTLRIYSNLSDYFNLKNIVFSSQDPGYLFTVGYTFK